ncbi:hypothetical protein [Fontibacillus sp. BL9]|uniref:hypothetical protein n=1 Tax=Fontibacillus sp. BL9 TaxID=3389971 RepID=UPI00397ABEE7
MSNYNIFLILLVVVTAGLFVIPYLRSQGFLNREQLEDVSEVLNIVQIMIQTIDMKGLDRTKASFVFEIADMIIEYVSELYNDMDNGDKIKLTLEVVEELVIALRLTMDETTQNLLEIVIRGGFEENMELPLAK